MATGLARAHLVLEDGSVFAGRPLGAPGWAFGEVVFSTSMTGYQEMLTDPSYAGQILVFTYPLIGNYGVNAADVESRRIQAAGLVVREACPLPSHSRSQRTLDDYLKHWGVAGIAGVDTRALTRRLRLAGVMMGAIAGGEAPQEALARLRALPRYDDIDFVRQVSTAEPYLWDAPDAPPLGSKAGRRGTGYEPGDAGARRPHIVVIDSGVKYNILRILHRKGCRVTAVPCATSAEEILALGPDGVLLSPGPGDPALLDYLVATARGLIGKLPLMGICLGHQVVGRAFGARTFKLKFGHRGANHPVKDLLTGRVHITAQNHGYAVNPEGLSGGLEVSHLHLNDGTVEGLWHRSLPILTIQYHSEASPGPMDNVYLFDRFLAMVRKGGR